MDALELGLDPAKVWDLTTAQGVVRWLSKSPQTTTAGETVRPVIVDDEEVAYQHEVPVSAP